MATNTQKNLTVCSWAASTQRIATGFRPKSLSWHKEAGAPQFPQAGDSSEVLRHQGHAQVWGAPEPSQQGKGNQGDTRNKENAIKD